MKTKALFTSVLFLASFFGFSQISLKKLDGTVINDNDILTFTSATSPNAYLGFKVYNAASSDTKVKIKVQSLVNTTGTNVQLCFGVVCVATIVQGNSYPNIPVTIPANGQNSNFDHFENLNTGNGVNYPMDYVFKFYQVNDSGVEVGNSVTFTYRFNPNLAIDDFTQLENSGIVLNSSLIQSQLDIRATKNNTMQLFDLNGKLIKTATLPIGEHAIDTSNLISGMYILKFRNEEEGQESSIKIMKN